MDSGSGRGILSDIFSARLPERSGRLGYPLREIDVATAPDWLKNHGFRGGAPRVRELGGGVSNIVILAESEQYRLVLKQALGRLRVTEEWCSDRDRIFRAVAYTHLTLPT